MNQGGISIDATAPSGPPPEDGWATFNVDRFLVERVKRFHALYRFVCAVETGTSKGHTTVGLAKIFPRVYTIEVDPEAYAETKPRFRCYPNVTAILGNSSEVLKHILPELKYPLFIYLDAHWESYKGTFLDGLTPVQSDICVISPFGEHFFRELLIGTGVYCQEDFFIGARS